MDFPVNIFLGWQWRGRYQKRRPEPRPYMKVAIHGSDIDAAGSYAGSYHVLEMGRHYTAYSTVPFAAPTFQFTPHLPSWCPPPLLQRTRAAHITGNAGEIVAGIVAHKILKAQPSEMAHLRSTSNMKVPDFLIVDSPTFRRFISAVSGRPEVQIPEYWPLESKAGSGSLDRAVSVSALIQLISYWHHIRRVSTRGVGYGVIITTETTPRRITVAVLMPRSQHHARYLIRLLHSTPALALSAETTVRKVTRCLAGCS